MKKWEGARDGKTRGLAALNGEGCLRGHKRLAPGVSSDHKTKIMAIRPLSGIIHLAHFIARKAKPGLKISLLWAWIYYPQSLWICLLDLKCCWASPPATNALLSFIFSFLALMRVDQPRYLPMIFRQILSR